MLGGFTDKDVPSAGLPDRCRFNQSRWKKGRTLKKPILALALLSIDRRRLETGNQKRSMILQRECRKRYAGA